MSGTLALLCASFVVAAPLPGPPFLEHVSSRADFDRIARTYGNGDFAALPHIQVVLDRAPGGKLYFINAQRYPMHRDFMVAQYLTLENGKSFFRHNYIDPKRRFVLATLAFQPSIQGYTLEIFEGDLATPELLRELLARSQAGFFAPIAFKPNSTAQETIARGLTGVRTVTSTELWKARDEIVFNRGTAVGTLRWVPRLTDDVILRRDEVVIFGESPVALTPITALLTTSESTPLAHVNVLAHGWHIPNAYVRAANEKWRALLGKPVVIDTRSGPVRLREATVAEVKAAQVSRARVTPRPLAADLSTTTLAPLSAQRATDAVRFGAKSANLGEVVHALASGRASGFSVPPGFSIPFAYFDRFEKQNRLDKDVDAFLAAAPGFDARERRDRLSALRARFVAATLDPETAKTLVERRHRLLGEGGVFVRSSTNAEDLPGFSGAGLYTTVPNVVADEALLEAVKTVWASIWNEGAYAAREQEGVDHRAVRAAVLVQVGVDAQAAGVLLTVNPFDTSEREMGVVYINAKRGLGIRVVEGVKIPEQLLFDVRRRSIRVLSRAADTSMLSFQPDGGVRDVPIEADRQVLTDALVRKLADAATQVRAVFGQRPQDIEWLTVQGRVVIVQARPYLTTAFTP